jgi:tetratricopeptide (TPR) repeat protein
VLALGCYALALFSKTTACTLPAALFLILWLKREPINGRHIAQIAPFVAVGIGMGLVTIWWERFHQGTQGELFAIGLPERFLIASRAIWFYLGKLAWPAHLSFSYPHWTISATHPADYVWLVATAALVAAIFMLRRYVGRGAEAAGLFFVCTLSPVLGFIMLYTFRYSFVADHYQYLACIGPLALVAAGMTKVFDLFRSQARFLKPIVCGVSLFLLAMRTWQQSAAYADIETLWRSIIAENPESWMAHDNLGIRLAQSGRLDEAFVHYHKALELNPSHAETYYNLGNALVRARRPDEAIAQYNKALDLEPRISGAHANLADILLRRGQTEEAITHFEKSLERDETNPLYHKRLADAFRQAGRLDEAVAHFNRALELKPGFAEAHFALGQTLQEHGREEEALLHFRKAAQLDSRLTEPSGL